MTILSLLLFLVALGVLVSIHELGHLIAAKSFNVFCSDYSIGFGPKIIKYKRKGGETTFSIGILPLGGYVSMYGEEGEIPDGTNVPRSRSLEGIKRWKRIIIMAAGIIMNFILAYVIFFISASCFPNIVDFYINVVSINDENVFKENVKKVDGSELDDELLTFFEDKPAMDVDILSINVRNNENDSKNFIPNYYFINTSNVTYKGESSYVLAFDLASLSYNDTDLSKYIKIFEGVTYRVGDELPQNYESISKVIDNELYAFEEGTILNLPLIDENFSLKEVTLNADEEIKAEISFRSTNEEEETITNKVLVTFSKNSLNELQRVGFGSDVNYRYLGWDSFKVAGENWVESTTLISNALIDLFSTTEAWNNVGGPIAIFTQTTTILTNNPFYVYLNSWGMISVNLALFNLLPFPGLDGWQILVEIVEGIVNGIYKLNKKVKRKNNNNKNKDKDNVIDNVVYTIKKNNENMIVSEVKDDKVSINKDTNLIVGNNEETSLTKEKIEYDDEWHIPQKVKNIMSTIGLVLLFALFFVIVIKDVIGLF